MYIPNLHETGGMRGVHKVTYDHSDNTTPKNKIPVSQGEALSICPKAQNCNEEDAFGICLAGKSEGNDEDEEKRIRS